MLGESTRAGRVCGVDCDGKLAELGARWVAACSGPPEDAVESAVVGMSADPSEHLSSDECWTLLRMTTVARLAVATDRGPDIFPINFVVDHGTLVFRTAAGTKLLAALANDTVAVEMDGLDLAATKAWSVVVKGHAAEINGVQETIDTFDLPLFPWHESPKNRFIRITPAEVTGRRFPVTDPAHWGNPLSGAPHTAVD